MQVIDRKDNPLLNRVEIRFVWDHPNSPTPDLSQMVSGPLRSNPVQRKSLFSSRTFQRDSECQELLDWH